MGDKDKREVNNRNKSAVQADTYESFFPPWPLPSSRETFTNNRSSCRTINTHILTSCLHLLPHPVPLVVNKQKYNKGQRSHQTVHYCHTDVSRRPSSVCILAKSQHDSLRCANHKLSKLHIRCTPIEGAVSFCRRAKNQILLHK